MIHVSPTLSPVVFIKSLLFANKKNCFPNIKQYSYARGALIEAIHSITRYKKLSSYPTVWAPAYISDTVFYSFDAYNIPYQFYPITKHLLPDWEKIYRCDIKENDIFLLVYFFGFPMGIEQAVGFCKKKKIFLIEDCAHSIIPSIENEGIGNFGDAAIFGLRKALPIPHGGFLYMKNIPFCEAPKITSTSGIYRSPYKMMIQYFFHKYKIAWNKGNYPVRKFESTKFPSNYSCFNFFENMDSISRKITNIIDINKIIIARRKNFQIYYEALKNVELIQIPKTLNLKNHQATPWIFFFYYDNAEELINYLRIRGIPAIDFPNFHQNVLKSDNYKLEKELYKKSVGLPVHQDLSTSELYFIINEINSFIKSQDANCIEKS